MLVVAAFLAIPGPAVPDFASPVNFDVGSAPRSVQVADLRGNGIRDLVTANFGNDSISVVLGNGDGTFQPALNIAVGRRPLAVAVADFDGDQIPDLVVANSADDTASVLLGNGDGTFHLAGNFAVGPNPIAVAVGDFNGDRKPDIVTANLGRTGMPGDTVSVLLGNGDGTFQAPRTFPAGRSPTDLSSFSRFSPLSLAVADFNRGR
jgi:hypothetical protein